MKTIRTIGILAAVLILASGCNKIKQVQQITEKFSGDRLYFCERYVTTEIGEGTQFKPGKLTVMVKLQNPIGEKDVKINVTDLASGKVVNTEDFTVSPSYDYIHFDNIDFKDKGKYKVSCLKPDGTVIVSGEVEII